MKYSDRGGVSQFSWDPSYFRFYCADFLVFLLFRAIFFKFSLLKIIPPSQASMTGVKQGSLSKPMTILIKESLFTMSHLAVINIKICRESECTATDTLCKGWLILKSQSGNIGVKLALYEWFIFQNSSGLISRNVNKNIKQLPNQVCMSSILGRCSDFALVEWKN